MSVVFYTGIMGYCDGRTLDSAVMIRFLEQEGENLYYKAGEESLQRVIYKVNIMK